MSHRKSNHQSKPYEPPRGASQGVRVIDRRVWNALSLSPLPLPPQPPVQPDTVAMADDAATPSSTSSYAYLSSLPEPLRELSIRALAPPDRSYGENCREGVGSIATAGATFTAGDKLDEFEISTRSHLLKLAEQLLVTCSNSYSSFSPQEKLKEQEIVGTLLQYLKNVTLLCLHVVKHHAASSTNPPPPPPNDTTNSSNSNVKDNNYHDVNYSHLSTTLPLKKLPFLLIEDAFDTLPLSIIQTLWSSNTQHPNLNLSSYATSLLCSPTIFTPPSKFVLLRICNKLLRQLSNQKAEDAEFAGSIMILLAKVFPLSERSAVNVLGSYNVRKLINTDTSSSSSLLLESYEQSGDRSNGMSALVAEEGAVATDEGKLSSNDLNDDMIGYDFYKTFWGVQKVFTDPPGTILPMQLSQAVAADAYGSFMKDITSILMALESTPIPKGASSTTTININDDDCALSDRHHKYLTSRQLLHLQLKDVQLRVHFLTQLLIVLSHLASPNVTLPVPSLASDGSKATVQARVAEQTKQLTQVEQRGMELLRATVSSPSGKGTLCRFLSWILKDRESMWRAWKRAKCMPALDKAGNINVSGSVIHDMLAGEKKRKAEAADLEGCSDSGKKRVDANTGEMTQISSLPDITDRITQSLPTLESFLNPYVEALDPDNGIEGEYHPRNDKVYCWRALRLLARDQKHLGQLCRFGKLRRRDGDFEGIVRDMWKAEKEGEIIGGTMIDAKYYADEIDLNDVIDEVSGCGGVTTIDNDVEMLDDAASVGTPEEDVEARKEKMAEFERAAMEVEENMLNEEEDEKEVQIASSVIQNAGVNGDAVVVNDNGIPLQVVSNNATTKSAPNVSRGEETKEKFDIINEKGPVVVTAQSKGKTKKNDKLVFSKGNVIATTSSPIGNDQSSLKVDQKKDEQKQKKEETKTSAPARPKFTPPQKKQQQTQPQHQPQPNEASRDNSRGRFVGRKDNTDQAPQQHQQQHQSRIPPPQNHSQRSNDQRGSSGNDAGQDSMKRRDVKSQSPPHNKLNDSGQPRSGGGVGLGNKGKGGWEPPPPPPPPGGGRGGGGKGRGGGGGGEGHGGNYRERRHGGGGRR